MQNIIRKKLAVCIVCVMLTIPGLVGAQQDTDEGNESGELTINFQEVDIRTVIKSVAKMTGRSFIVDPRVKGEVTIISSEPVADENLYDVFLAVLQVHDYAAIESDGVTKVVPLADAKNDNTIIADAETKAPGAAMVTRLFKLQHVDAERLVPILRPLVPTKSYLAAQTDSNMLIISDRQANVERLGRIIRKIDKEKTGQFEVIKLDYATASEVVKIIEGLEGKTTRKQSDELRLIADERTNSILLSGEKNDILRARTLISHLDSPIDLEGSTQVIFLRFAKSKELAAILKGVDVEDPTKQPRRAQNAAASEVNIQADEATNSLIITASPSELKNLMSVIRKLDIRRPQVMIEAIIAEVTVDKSAELGIQWRLTDLTSGTEKGVLGGTSFSGGTAAPSINELSANPGAAIGLQGFNIGYVQGTASILGNEILNIGSLLSALASDTDTNILSTPSLVTLDNEEAEIIVGQNVPFPTGSYTGAGNTTPDNPFTTVERHDIGVKLKVVPQINEGDAVRLEITQEVSNLTRVSELRPELGPTTNTREIRTIVMVEDGKMLVLGGLISDDVQETEQRVPLLGSLPLLGYFFRYNTTSHTKRNLMVFLKPTILRTAVSETKISFDKYDYMRRMQLDYNEDGIRLLPNDRGPVLEELE